MEMMVVIALITILAMIGVPQYQTFQAKARQKEGFLLATTFFTAASTARVEYNYFPGNWVATGFQPQGVMNYRLRSVDGTDPPAGIPNDDGCVNGAQACDCGGTCPSYVTWTENLTGVGVAVGASGCNWGLVCGPPAQTDSTYQILICGIPSARSLTLDQYALNHLKQFTMCSDGLK